MKFHSHDLPRVPPRLPEQNSGCPCQRGSRCRTDVPGGGWPARRGRAGWRAAAHRPGPAPAPLLRAAGCRARPGSAPACGPQAGPSQAWLTERRQLGHPGRSSLPPPRSWRHQPPTLRNTGRPPPRCADGRTRSSCRGGPWDSDPCSPPPQSHLLREPGRLREGPTGTRRASSASCCCVHAQRPTPRPGSPRLLQGSRCLPPAGTARRQCWAGPGPGRGGREGRGRTGAGGTARNTAPAHDTRGAHPSTPPAATGAPREALCAHGEPAFPRSETQTAPCGRGSDRGQGSECDRGQGAESSLVHAGTGAPCFQAPPDSEGPRLHAGPAPRPQHGREGPRGRPGGRAGAWCVWLWLLEFLVEAEGSRQSMGPGPSGPPGSMLEAQSRASRRLLSSPALHTCGAGSPACLILATWGWSAPGWGPG